MQPFAYIQAIDSHATAYPDRVAFCNSRGESITYGRLKAASDSIACALLHSDALAPGQPCMVYGHKSPYMLACFLACAKSGHAYVAVDTAYPTGRVVDILNQVGNPLLLDTTREGALDVGAAAADCIRLPQIVRMASEPCDPQALAELPGLAPDDTLYILFTSGSTGTPKGIEVTAECMDNFCAWLCGAYPDDRPVPQGATAPAEPQVFFDKVPFSFDLSLTDLALSLTCGHTMFALEREHEENLADTFAALASSGARWWISTPSFVDLCLADPSFDAELMPNLSWVFMVGEVLRPSTVEALHRRFPGIRVVNGYGPTESTDAVTSCIIEPSMIVPGKTLPIGYAKPGSELVVLDPVTLEPVPDGQPGELFIIGDTVAKGYYGRPELTQAAFHSCPPEIARGRRSFRTGDECIREADGMFYFHGRLDLQIKLHGYRIELGDIEASLSELPEVQQACVLPVWRDGTIARLTAYVVPADPDAPRGLALTRQLKEKLQQRIPRYMVPATFKYLDEVPLNVNGKVDRKALAALVDA